MQEQSRHIDLFTNDLYQFTCSYCYFLSQKHQETATFEIFFRKYPFGGEYVILAGIQAIKQFLSNLQFTQANEDYLRELLPSISNEWYQWIRQDFRSKIQIKSMKQGQVVFAKEPIITYTGPIGFIQLLETPFLNLLGFASLVATNASRMVKAVQPKQCIQFGLRRAQGPDGGLSASQYAYLGGFSGTSNIIASKLYKIPCYGTMSHAFITSFSKLSEATSFTIGNVDIYQRSIEIKKELGFQTHEGELAAFIMYAKAFPNTFRTLIDTYNTLQSGLINTIIVGKALLEAGVKTIGIRLDSGDLCQYSIKARKIWNKYIPDNRLIILASDDLHEDRLVQIEKNKSQIDIYAIGTNIATCKKQPALGLVCKLVEINNIPKMKFSEDGEKATYPAKKVIYRIWTNAEGPAKFDLIALQGEDIKSPVIAVDPSNHLKKYEAKIDKIQQLNHVWDLLDKTETTVQESKTYKQSSVNSLPANIFNLKNAEKYPVFMTEKYVQVYRETMESNSIVLKL